MKGQMTYLFALATIVGVVTALAGLLVAGALVAAALFPRGHPFANRLREAAGLLPKLWLLGIRHLESVVVILAVLLFGLVTIWYS